jgi:hypothetical protein
MSKTGGGNGGESKAVRPRINPDALLESRTLRNDLAARTGVLDKVKFLRLLPDNQHATTEMVASYYEVPEATIRQTARRFRTELAEDGLKKVSRKELFNLPGFASDSLSLANFGSKTRGLLLFPRRAVLRIGMLLRDSEVAKQVRTYLLDAEHVTTAEDVERMRLELEILREKYRLETGVLEARTRLAEAEHKTQLLDFTKRHFTALAPSFREALLARLAGMAEPTDPGLPAEKVGEWIGARLGCRVTASRVGRLAAEKGIKVDPARGELENEYTFISVTKAAHCDKVVPHVLYKRAALPVLLEAAREWLAAQAAKRRGRKVVPLPQARGES